MPRGRTSVVCRINSEAFYVRLRVSLKGTGRSESPLSVAATSAVEERADSGIRWQSRVMEKGFWSRGVCPSGGTGFITGGPEWKLRERSSG